MTVRAPLRRVVHLPPEPSSPGRARSVVRALLGEAGRESWREAAALAVSELVTNAVLHAHSDIELVAQVADDHLRLEVGDDNPVLPAVRSYDDHATTGRGLELVAAVTSSHGVESRGTGKVVWCCISAPVDEPSDGEPPAEWDDALDVRSPADAASEEDASTVLLQRLPATLWLAAREHHDALLRELSLVRAAGGDPAAVDVAAVDAARATLDTAVDAEVERARREGVASVPLPQDHPGVLPAVPDEVDLHVRVARDQGDGFAQLQDLLDEGERLAAADRLLVRPGQPELVAVRDWACEQVIAQLAGSPAAPWPGADDERFTRAFEHERAQEVEQEVEPGLTTAGWDDTPVTSAADGAIAVDESNRVVAVSRPLAELLGWQAEDLVGRRVVAIVPHRYREAHVAGFSRHLRTGEARALGVPLELPVLRADGRELVCRFLIESSSTPQGRTVYVAQITPVAGASPELP